VNPHRRIPFQQAYVVNDLEEACRRWSKVFGAGPFAVRRHHETSAFSYRGTDVEADVSYAFGYLGDQMVQFIEQHDDKPSIYREMYAAGEEGFHHMAYLVHDVEPEKQRLLGLGFEIACELNAGPAVHAVYFDTRDATGGFTELHNDPPRILGLFAQWQRAHELARHGDSPFWVAPDAPTPA
jgi:catechol 2,3-dioxygenase-like lactoylglutathione lyase family enzyme